MSKGNKPVAIITGLRLNLQELNVLLVKMKQESKYLTSGRTFDGLVCALTCFLLLFCADMKPVRAGNDEGDKDNISNNFSQPASTLFLTANTSSPPTLQSFKKTGLHGIPAKQPSTRAHAFSILESISPMNVFTLVYETRVSLYPLSGSIMVNIRPPPV